MDTMTIDGGVIKLIESASDKHFTLNAEQLLDFAKQVIATITAGLCKIAKKPAMSEAKVLEKVKELLLDSDGNISEELNFFCDQDALTTVYESVKTYLTETSYNSESANIIHNIKTNQDFAYKFFYGSSTIPGKSICRLRSNIINNVRKSYNVDIDPNDFSTILYEHLWSDGTWKVLDSYSYRSSFYQWLRVVASHCIMSYLEDNGYIKISRARTPANTRLIFGNYTSEYCQTVIDEMVHIKPIHDYLVAVYVDRFDKQEIMTLFNLDEQMYKLTLKASEKVLQTALLNSDHQFEDVLVDKAPRRITLPSDFLTVIGQTNAAYTETSPLREVLGINQDDSDFEKKVIEFLHDFTDKMPWDDEEKKVWKWRYIQDMKPVDVAEMLSGRSRHWVDTKFSRLRKEFNIAIRKWWNDINSKKYNYAV